MFKRIVIVSETSPDSLNVFKCLNGLRKLGAEEYLLLKCLFPHDRNTIYLSSFITLEENLRKQQEMLIEQGYKVEIRNVTGSIGTEINRIAADENYSIIVAGATEHTMVEEVFPSTVASEVIHHAGKPVLLINISDNPDEMLSCTAEKYSIIDHILFPTDFSENAALAFEYVKKMVAYGARKVTLAHVQDQARINSRLGYGHERFDIIDTPEETVESEILPPQLLEKSDILNAMEEIGESEILPSQLLEKPDILNTPKMTGESEILPSLRIERLNIIDTERLEEMKKELQEKGDAEIDICLLYGSPSLEIIKIVREQKIPLVVMGSQGHGFVRELYLGSVSHNVARHSSASVLLIPAERDKK